MSDVYQGIRAITCRDPRYSRAAYYFVFQALDYTLKQRKRTREHVRGQDLLQGIRELALEEFGFLARTVFNDWGVHRTEDFGEIVFNLIEQELMRKNAQDSREDFAGGFDFADAFEKQFRLSRNELDISR